MRLSLIRSGATRATKLADRSFTAKFSESVRGPPWHRLSATYGLGFGDAVRGAMPGPRDWIALEEEPGFARMIGRVVSPQAATGGGPDSSSTVSVEAEGFLDAARANDVISSPGARSGTIGTLFEYGDWIEGALKNYVDTFQYGNLGPFLQKLVALIIRMEMPPALLRGSIGDAIYVMHEPGAGAGSALNLLSPRVLDPVRGFNVGGVRSMLKTQGKAIDLLVGTFAASDLLVEMFPSLEPVPAKLHRAVYAGGSSGSFGGQDGTVPPPEVLGNYLTVVYRIKPWRPRALSLAIKEPTPSNTSPPGSFFTPTAYPDDPYAFDRETWTVAHEARAPLVGAPFHMTAGKRNDNVVNGCSAWLSALAGGDDLKVFEALGLPILRPKEEIERDGFRMASANWPFLPAPGTDAGGGRLVRMEDIFAFVQRLTAATMQFYQPAADLFSGTFQTGLDLRVRAGEIVRVPVPGGKPMAAYVDKVEHALEVDEQGGVRGTTSVEFSRGAFDFSVRDVDVAAPLIKVPKTKPDRALGERHIGVIFGGVQHAIILDWPWTDDAEVILDPDPTTLRVIHINATDRAVFIRDRINKNLTAVLTALELSVMSEARLFVYGDTVPSAASIQEARVGVNLYELLEPSSMLEGNIGGLKSSRTLKPGAIILDAPADGSLLGWPVIAATGERHSADGARPNIEALAVELEAVTGGNFGLRDPATIRYVILHVPSMGIRGTARNNAIQAFIGNMKNAIDDVQQGQLIAYERQHGVSAHFVIDRKGCVWQLQDALRYAVHTESHYNSSGFVANNDDWINSSSISIELAVPSSKTGRRITRAEIISARGAGFEYPDPDAKPIPQGHDHAYTPGAAVFPADGRDRDCRRGGTFPEGGLVSCTMLGRGVKQDEIQPSRQQYRALGALLSVIKQQCPNFKIEFPGQDGRSEFTWAPIPVSSTGRYTADNLLPGVYIHACLRSSRTDHMAVHRKRVLAYGDGSVSETGQRRDRGDKL